MPYVNVPNDLSKVKTKIAFNLTKRQLICFGIGMAIGIPTYLLPRGLPFEKVLRNQSDLLCPLGRFPVLL